MGWWRIWSPDSPYTKGTPATGGKYYEAWMSDDSATDLVMMLRLITGDRWYRNEMEEMRDTNYIHRSGYDEHSGKDGRWMAAESFSAEGGMDIHTQMIMLGYLDHTYAIGAIEDHDISPSQLIPIYERMQDIWGGNEGMLDYLRLYEKNPAEGRLFAKTMMDGSGREYTKKDKHLWSFDDDYSEADWREDHKDILNAADFKGEESFNAEIEQNDWGAWECPRCFRGWQTKEIAASCKCEKKEGFPSYNEAESFDAEDEICIERYCDSPVEHNVRRMVGSGGFGPRLIYRGLCSKCLPLWLDAGWREEKMDAESFSAERKKKKSGCLHFKYGKHCWAYSGNGAICVDCGLTTYIDEDGKKSYGTRSIPFKGNYDAHQAESFESYKVASPLASYTVDELVSSKAGPQGSATYDQMVYDPVAQDRMSAESFNAEGSYQVYLYYGGEYPNEIRYAPTFAEAQSIENNSGAEFSEIVNPQGNVVDSQTGKEYPPLVFDAEFNAKERSVAKKSWDTIGNVETAVGTVGLAHMIGLGALLGGGLAFLKGRKSNSKTEK